MQHLFDYNLYGSMLESLKRLISATEVSSSTDAAVWVEAVLITPICKPGV